MTVRFIFYKICVYTRSFFFFSSSFKCATRMVSIGKLCQVNKRKLSHIQGHGKNPKIIFLKGLHGLGFLPTTFTFLKKLDSNSLLHIMGFQAHYFLLHELGPKTQTFSPLKLGLMPMNITFIKSLYYTRWADKSTNSCPTNRV